MKVYVVMTDRFNTGREAVFNVFLDQDAAGRAVYVLTQIKKIYAYFLEKVVIE